MADGHSIESRGPAVLAVTTTVIVASSCFVVLRFITRIGLVRRFTWDDCFMALAWFIALGLSLSICLGTTRGLGLRDKDINPDWQPALTRYSYTFSVLYNPALMATKTSILVFYLNLAKTQPIFKWATWTTLCVVNLAGIALTFLNICQCRPVHSVFDDPLPPGAKCIDIVTLYLSSAPVNIITDLAILVLPMPILTGMRLPRKQKRILVFTFCLGGFVAVVDVVRIAYLQQAALSRLVETNRTGSRLAGRNDYSWYASLSYMWSAVEVNVGIICACIPTLKPLFVRVMPSMIRDSRDFSHYTQSRHSRRVSRASNVPLGGDEQGVKPKAGQEDGSSAGVSPAMNGPPELDMIDFLTTPETTEEMLRNQSAANAREKDNSGAFFDFVDMNRPRSMVKLTNRESFVPVATVTILFFLWGFAYGLLNVLNAQFELIVHMGMGRSLGLQSAYWVGYFVAPLTFGRLVLKKWGFKATFVTGLCIYGCGTLIFWPSAVLASFPAFLISNFIVGLGLATLEVAANPFIILCGPMRYAETRSNLAQGFQAIGSVVSPLLAKRVLFKNVLDAPSLIDVQWAYLGIAFFDIALALVFYYIPIPEAPDDDLETIAERDRDLHSRRIGGTSVATLTLILGVTSQFFYVGGQEAVSTKFERYVSVVRPGSTGPSPFNLQAIAHTCFAAGRFLAAALGIFMRPRWILAASYVGLVVTSALAMSLKGNSAVTALLLLSFFESAIFPTIFAISLRGLGKHTKSASALLTAATSGGAIFPVVMQAVNDNRGIQYSFSVVVAVFAVGTTFPLFLNLVPAAQRHVDPDTDVHSVCDTRMSASGILRRFKKRRRPNEQLSNTDHVDRVRWPGFDHG